MVKSRFLTIILILSLWFSTTAFQPATPGRFSPLAAPSDPFEPRLPANGATNVMTTGVHLSWTAQTPPQGSNITYTYRYCLNIRNKCPGGKWVNVNTSTNVPVKTLQPNTTYYWWIRAIGSDGSIVNANNGTSWTFTTAALPGAFTKSLPANLSANQPVNNLTLSWAASTGAASYDYCLDTTNNNLCDTGWVNVPVGTSVVVGNLTSNTNYFWQVRAVSPGGTALADGGIWWQFTTTILSNVFGKLYPADKAINVPATTLTLSWEISTGATSYDYCLSKTSTLTGQNCDTGWVSLGLVNQVTVSNLNYSTDYYWQVRANSAGGQRLADGGVFGKFSTIYSPPGAFGKTAPANGLANVPVNTTITWDPAAAGNGPAPAYEYCIMLTPSSVCDSTWTPATGTSALISGLSYDTTYYWQVHAINPSGTTEADNGQWFSFATQTAPPGAFTKASPIGGIKVSNNPTLTWSASPGSGVAYQVCFTTTPAGGCTTWYPTSSTSMTLYGLSFGTTYSWQVRAFNLTDTTYADGSPTAFATFTTLLAPPAVFFKSSPADGITGQPQNVSLDWTSSDAGVTYEVCVDTVTPGCAGGTGWQAAAMGYTPPNLAFGQKYYWQVRAKNTDNTLTYADTGAWWDFTVRAAPPTGFIKTSPTGTQPQPRDPWLYWSTSTGSQITYEYCVSKTIDVTCGGAWSLASSNTSIHYPGLLDNGATYYWQVRAKDNQNPPSYTYADGGASSWLSFTVVPVPPVGHELTVNNIMEGQPYTGAVIADNPGGLPLTFALAGNPLVGSVVVNPDGTFTFTPPSSFTGPATFQFTVSDGVNLPQGPYTVTLNYVHVNHAPVLNPIPDIQVRSGELVTFTAVAVDPDPADTLTFSLDTTPTGATFDTVHGVFGWVPTWKTTLPNPNVYHLTVTVTDAGGAHDSKTLTITVLPLPYYLPIITR